MQLEYVTHAQRPHLHPLVTEGDAKYCVVLVETCSHCVALIPALEVQRRLCCVLSILFGLVRCY